ncbi:MAG: hypothetical protein KDA37_14340 [Planctomycetales bacterium]|nr:hypothetical protein [Planctomycetales bacterium]
MSEPAAFALIRDGKRRFYTDRWASATLRREVLWGPDDFEAWVSQFEQLDEWAEECDGGAVVDFDNRKLIWSGDDSGRRAPKIGRIYQRLLQAAWPGFEVKGVDGDPYGLSKYLGVASHPPNPDDDEREDYDPRPKTVEAARLDQDVEEDDPEEDDYSEPRAWVTLIESDGAPRHRQLEELPLDLLRSKASALDALVKLPPAEIPKEADVSEGFLINLSNNTAIIWGHPDLLARMKQFGKRWRGWKLEWVNNGYAKQCALCGTKGQPMSDVEALAKILPLALSTEQFSLAAVMGAAGKGLMKWGWRICFVLIALSSLPLLAFGVFSGAWLAVLYAFAATSAVIIGLFLFIVRRVRRSLSRNLLRQSTGDAEIACAGPQDKQQRRTRIDGLLAACRLPGLAEVEPHFDESAEAEAAEIPRSVRRELARLTAPSGFYSEKPKNDSDPPLYAFADWLEYEEVQPADLPSSATDAWRPLLQQLEELGFQRLRLVRPRNIGLKLSYALTLYHDDGDSVATLTWLRLPGEDGVVESSLIELNTYCEDDPDIVTGVVEMQHMAVSDIVRIHGVEIENHDIRRPLSDIYARHLERCAGRKVCPVDASSIASLFDDRSRRRFQQLLEAGSIRELSQAEADVVLGWDAKDFQPS